MAVHAKSSGLMISVRLLEDTDTYWRIHAVDEKRPKCIQKSDRKNKVFTGDFTMEDVYKWIEEVRKV